MWQAKNKVTQKPSLGNTVLAQGGQDCCLSMTFVLTNSPVRTVLTPVD